MFIRKLELDSYLEKTGQSLLYRRFANRGFFDLRGSQIDLRAFLKYNPQGGFGVVHEESEAFNC